ncbi:Ribose import permease protein RbsC [subsurface metagenome]|jgi:ribose/xylose/arabinose/galactoside ABC-type transport system permease subunit
MQKRIRRVILSQGGIYLALLGLVIAFSLSTPYFFTTRNLFNILRQSSTTCLLSIGQTFVIISGGIDLSVGAGVALCSVIIATLNISMGVPLIIAILIGLIAGIALGAFHGLCVTKFKIAPFIVTLGTMSAYRGLALKIAGGLPISPLSPFFSIVGNGYVLKVIPIPVLIVITMTLLAFFILKYTSFGRYIYALGGNEEAARVSGINVGFWKVITYIFSGLMMALAAILLSGRLNTAEGLMARGTELKSITAVILGGSSLFGGEGSVVGSIIGTLIVGTIGNGLNLLAVDPFEIEIIIGLLLIGVVGLDMWRKSVR